MKAVLAISIALDGMDPEVARVLLESLKELYFSDGSTMPVILDSLVLTETEPGEIPA